MTKMLRENFGVELPRNSIYQKPYQEYFDAIQCPLGYKISDFVQFNGEHTKNTWNHVIQYLAQLGEASSRDEWKVRYFPLSLTGTAFLWFSALPPGSITTWFHLEQKFHDHFIVVIVSLSCHILHRLDKSMMNRSPITSRDLEIQKNR